MKYYLCMCTTTNIKKLFSYKGSGKRWKLHLAKHGNYISTCILGHAHSRDAFIKLAAPYNKIWNVGSSENFLNLKPEEGDGGNTWVDESTRAHRALQVSNSLKLFNQTLKGQSIRKRVGEIAHANQFGKTMKDRIGKDYIDPRKGKKFAEIYKDGYNHPQQRPFKITCNGRLWTFNNETEFTKILHIHADPILRELKRNGYKIIKHVKRTSKHPFNKGDVLVFEWVT